MHFRDYFWKQGKPVGIGAVAADAPVSFKIIVDPYRKRISLERYHAGQFHDVVYDSYLFDFRYLSEKDQQAWQRTRLYEDEAIARSLLRNMDDRVILIEEAHFSGEDCIECRLHSPHGIWVATQKIYDTRRGDPFDGMALIDRLDHPVLLKKYARDPESRSFTTLLAEVWEHAQASI